MTPFMPISDALDTRRAVLSQIAVTRAARQGARFLAQAMLTVCLAVALCVPLAAQAAPYGHYDLRQLLIPAAAGASGGTFSMRYLDGMLDDIALHAGSYAWRLSAGASMRFVRLEKRR